MRYVVFLSIIFTLVIACSTFGSTEYGPPTAALKQGQFSTGAEYVFADFDVKTKDASFGPVPLPSVTIKDVELNRAFFVPSYGLFDNVTIFGRLGATQMSIDASANKDNLGGQQGTSDWDFTAGAGAKVTLYKKDRLSWGVSGLFTWTDLKGFNPWSTVFDGIPITGNMKLTLYDYQFATGPAYQILDNWTVSAGPYLQFIDAQARLSAPVEGQEIKSTVDLTQDDYFGGYVSSQLMITHSIGWNARFSATGSGYTIGTSLSFAF